MRLLLALERSPKNSKKLSACLKLESKCSCEKQASAHFKMF